ncbi:hypothetical protein [Candidatus Viridilinea mediisalina]|uniref:Uncharacterized protein n=1 Tax=Candidatus Viridilinea mediisalina TaxID=2024553 RepID=A0A2A6RHL0_9CHLR|nr:hypothetical protein [Candidatus Viridilinea mediisalina]PDW02614.1 hypothetical protein CJ255_13075 [Candidatus Viridilinea mediisalina]
MIVTLVATVAEKLALEDRLKTNQAEIKSIEATLRALDKVAKTVREFTDQLEVCSPYLDKQVVADIRSQVQFVGQELATSRQRFATNRKEWLGIQKAESHLQRPIKDLADRWQSYASGRLSPYRELMRLVNYLPEVASSATELDQLVRSLEDQAKRPPRTQAQLEQCEGLLKTLGQRLDRVASLSIGIRAFLARVVDNQATLRDLTPEVQQWIAEGKREAAFAISFSQHRR